MSRAWTRVYDRAMETDRKPIPCKHCSKRVAWSTQIDGWTHWDTGAPCSDDAWLAANMVGRVYQGTHAAPDQGILWHQSA